MLTLPPEAATAVRHRYKVMGRADITVKHRPQDGAFRLLVNERAVAAATPSQGCFVRCACASPFGVWSGQPRRRREERRVAHR